MDKIMKDYMQEFLEKSFKISRGMSRRIYEEMQARVSAETQENKFMEKFQQYLGDIPPKAVLLEYQQKILKETLVKTMEKSFEESQE